MDKLTDWTSIFYSSIAALGEQLMMILPSIMGAILILFFGWMLSKLISSGFTKLLKVLKFDSLAEKVSATELLSKANISTLPSALFGKFVYWLLMLLVSMTAADVLGWNAITVEISKLIAYLPQLFIAIIFFIIGIYIAAFVRDLISGTTKTLGISSGRLIGSLVYYFLFIVISLTALTQAGFDTSIITSNLMLMIGAVLISAGISYGFASRDVLSNVLASFYTRKSYVVGNHIRIGEKAGIITRKNNVSITIEVKKGECVTIPMSKFINEEVTTYE